MVWHTNEQKLVDRAIDCRVCQQELPLGPKPIFRLHPHAKIALLSQAPGRIAHQSGTPWDDPGGKRLREWLAVSEEVFFRAENFAVLPLGLCYPGKGKGGDKPPRKECAPLWQKALLGLMPDLKLRVLIGGHAMRYHLGRSYPGSVTKTLKSWEKLAVQGYWPLPHPSPRNRAWLDKMPFFERDVLPALQRHIGQLLKDPV
ncbi:MAG: uracil-DNA glycosylase family protein [Bacteroidota bacterium]